MKPILLVTCAAGLLTISGCSSFKTNVDNGPVRASTFSYMTPGSALASQRATEYASLHSMVQDAITRNLAAKGLNPLPAGGDITVAYLIIVDNNGVTTALDEYFDAIGDAADLVDKVHSAEGSNSAARNTFGAGTLVIDLIDSRSSKLLWRNTIQRDILRNPTVEVRAARLQETVQTSLQRLTVSR